MPCRAEPGRANIGIISRGGPHPSQRRSLVAATVVMLALALAYLGLLAAAPSDGLVVAPQAAAWQGAGVRVSVVVDGSPARTGDVVVAVDGIPLRGWPTASTEQNRDGSVTYTVLRDGRSLDIMVELSRYPLGRLALQNWGTILFGTALAGVGAYLYSRRSGRPTAALVVLGVGLLASIVPFVLGLPVHEIARGTPTVWVYLATTGVAYTLAWSGALVFALSFPQPHPMLARHRGLVTAVYAVPAAAIGLAFAIAPWTSAPLGWIGTVFEAQSYMTLGVLAAVIALTVRSYRAIRDPVGRQQMRWLAFGGLASILLGVGVWLGPDAVLGRVLLPWSAAGIGGVPLLVGLSVAVLRYRLFDLDRVVSRAVSYAVLTVLVGLTYVVAVAVLGLVFNPLTQDSQLAVAGSTLAVAALFGPARRRVQSAVDRRFNRARYDAAVTVGQFAARLRDQVDLDQITEELLATVHATVQPTQAHLWLRAADVGR